jgi:4-alpha-glucanotransferase
MPSHPLNRERRAGVLLHPTSLPGSPGNGDFGHQAYRFIEWLSRCGFKVWQMLPLGPTHEDRSPYQCLSSHAGNPMLISLDWLKDRNWLHVDDIDDGVDEIDAVQYRKRSLALAAARFYQLEDDYWQQQMAAFEDEHQDWLPDYALFLALKKQYQDAPWFHWPTALRHRETTALEQARNFLQGDIKQTVFEQFVFFTQWQEIRDYASKHDVELFGDMPIFVAHDSADVWAQRENFLIDDDGAMQFIAGVPPDAFSETGQRWGNPLYDWAYMQQNDFDWWRQRFTSQLKLFDMIRVDHFRGLQACWQIPEAEETAINGEWEEVPGKQMLQTLFESFDHLPLVAEDLGMITDEVIELRRYFELPGMKVLQFAFDGNNRNPHLPHRHEASDLVYTGTHDNDTTAGWLADEENYNREYLQDYAGLNELAMEAGMDAMIRMAMASVSFICVLPMQDVLMLDSAARMNVPGTVDDNWRWRFDWQQMPEGTEEKFSHMMMLYQR